MDRISGASPSGASAGELPGIGNGGPDASEIGAATWSGAALAPPPETPAGRPSLEDELGRLYAALDRVDQQGSQRSGTPPDGFQPGTPPAPAAAGPRGSAASAAEVKDAIALPKATDLRNSLAAIKTAGFTDVHLRPVPYLDQGSAAWAKRPYDRSPPIPGESRTIGQAGCAPTALARVDCGLRDAHTSPVVTAGFAMSRRLSGSATSAGTNTAGLARQWAEYTGLGLTVGLSSQKSKNVDTLKAGLEANGIAMVSVGADAQTHRGHFSASSHVMVINGCAVRNGEEWFAVADPGRRDQSRPHPGLLATDADVVQLADAVNGCGRVWISRTQLEAEMKGCFVFHRKDES